MSIDDWVEFIRSFTIPKYELGELWKVQPTPMLVIHLSFKMKDKKKDDKKKKKAKNAKQEEGSEGEEEGNQVQFSPSLDKCTDFLKSALTMIVNSTNKVHNLEDDLMPFLSKNKEKTPNF